MKAKPRVDGVWRVDAGPPSMWKVFLVGAILVAAGIVIVTAARAGSNCYQLGNQWICDGSGGGSSWNTQTYQLGNQDITTGTYRDRNSGRTRSFNQSCYWLGNQYICN
jgi:hypothetical protein